MKGIYGYIDKKKDKIVYVGKDSNIHNDQRHKEHFYPSNYDKQPFNRVLQNNLDRYEYRVLAELSDDFSDNDLNNLERYLIRKYKTYHYEHPNGFNFTRGGDGGLGLEPWNKGKTITGILYVTRVKSTRYTQGYIYIYQYYIQTGKRIHFSRVNLDDLESEVKKRGLPWVIIDYEKYVKNKNKQNLKYIKTTNTTGIHRVHKKKDKKCNQGFIWCYRYYDENGKRKVIQRVNLDDLKREVKSKGLEWMILDEGKVKKALEDEVL